MTGSNAITKLHPPLRFSRALQPTLCFVEFLDSSATNRPEAAYRVFGLSHRSSSGSSPLIAFMVSGRALTKTPHSREANWCESAKASKPSVHPGACFEESVCIKRAKSSPTFRAVAFVFVRAYSQSKLCLVSVNILAAGADAGQQRRIFPRIPCGGGCYRLRYLNKW